MQTTDEKKKSVRQTYWRSRDGKYNCTIWPPKEVTGEEALSSLIREDLARGGKVTEINNGRHYVRITVVTPLAHCKDTTVLEGKAENMRPILEAIYFWVRENGEHWDSAVQRVLDQLGL